MVSIFAGQKVQNCLTWLISNYLEAEAVGFNLSSERTKQWIDMAAVMKPIPVPSLDILKVSQINALLT